MESIKVMMNKLEKDYLEFEKQEHNSLSKDKKTTKFFEVYPVNTEDKKEKMYKFLSGINNRENLIMNSSPTE